MSGKGSRPRRVNYKKYSGNYDLIFNEGVKEYSSTDRTESLRRLAPNLFDYDTVLYIGAKSDRFHYGDEFREAGYDITVLEAFQRNVNNLREYSWLKEVVHGDVRDLSYFLDKGQKFDVVFWWHGPEHVLEGELDKVVPQLEKVANRLVVMGCPWGRYDQGVIDGNPYERHVWAYSHDFFEKHGYSVECLGEPHVIGSNITSVKEII